MGKEQKLSNYGEALERNWGYSARTPFRLLDGFMGNHYSLLFSSPVRQQKP